MMGPSAGWIGRKVPGFASTDRVVCVVGSSRRARTRTTRRRDSRSQVEDAVPLLRSLRSVTCDLGSLDYGQAVLNSWYFAAKRVPSRAETPK